MLKMRWMQSEFKLLAAMLAFFACSFPARAQQGAPPSEAKQAVDPWAPVKLLAGSWEGAIDGKLGRGKGVRRYEFILNGRYLLSRHISVRLPQEKSPQGDQHEELGVFSFDSQRKMLVYREFMNEGVVVRSPCKVEGMQVVCTSEAVESGSGIRARLTLQIQDRYRFTEKYEIAWPGQEELELYFTNHWTRAPLPKDWD